MTLHEKIKNYDLESAEIELLNSAIDQLRARRYIESREEFAEIIDMPKTTFDHYMTQQNKMKKRTAQMIWNKIKEIDWEIYVWCQRVSEGNNDKD